MFLFLISNSCL